MKFACVYTLLGCLLIFDAVMYRGGWWLLVWPGLSCLLVGAAYFRLGPTVFGKQSNGHLPWFNTLLLLPFLLTAWSVWHLRRLICKEPIIQEIKPGLYQGRRLIKGELPDHIAHVVDLTSEFRELASIRQGRSYTSFPILDYYSPSRTDFLTLIETVREAKGDVFIHCAVGHGRATLLTAAVLLAQGEVKSVSEAVQYIQAIRPAARLSSAQSNYLTDLFHDQIEPRVSLLTCETVTAVESTGNTA